MRTILLAITTLLFTITGQSFAADSSSGSIRDHRTTGNSTAGNEVVRARRGRRPETATEPSEMTPTPSGLVAPSNLVVSDLTRTTLTLSWQDNSTTEYGVFVERMTPVEMRGGILENWEYIMKFEERVISNMRGTGIRSDTDVGLTPKTQYCYRLRAYNDTRATSGLSEVVCTRTR